MGILGKFGSKQVLLVREGPMVNHNPNSMLNKLINSFPGLRNTAFMTAVGKVLIGNLPQKQWRSFVDKIPAGYPRTTDEILRQF
ncbi:hypothetical protein [Neorhizobium galegae]|uniref:hypothetical protein n=1 Tax=Neorhizobium galegae TaxID=399 RepID=UPI0006215AEE|nr:hypothetical protein [Neorhizobium galegae]CDZ29747.1 Hypothetical protein NGAL_HAMBI490_46140 [Neorhizobium galegae bv. officinalis]KAA9383776.1 hypothetical protein F4V88_26125 [Neorhizobium galegae]MCM2500523.1 hypothetical protein [Neorhizobium galegae]MCQ1768184.1 hypothetical protein [Neorhizobium galegae]MCQ1770007.1 hypothetical protein [Neorhizobium galegae]